MGLGSSESRFLTVKNKLNCISEWATFYLTSLENKTLVLKRKRNSYLCVTPQNHQLKFSLWNILKSIATKNIIVCFKKTFKSITSIMALFEIHQRSLFERIACFLKKWCETKTNILLFETACFPTFVPNVSFLIYF